MEEQSDMGFWGLELKPKKPVTHEIEDVDNVAEFVHITNVALGKDPAPGPHTISIKIANREIVLATLEKGHAYQHHLDLVVEQTAVFTNSGASTVFISGYETISTVGELEGSEDEGEEFEDEDEDEEAPEAVPIPNGRKAGKKAAAQMDVDEDEDDEDEEGEDGEDEEGEDDDEDEEGLEGEEFPVLDEMDSDDIVGEFDSDDEGEEGEDDEDEEGEEEEDEEEEEEEAPKPAPKAKAGDKKRPANLTPEPAAKKQKPEQAQAPKSAPAKQQGGAPQTAEDYERAVAALLKQQNKPVNIAQLGSLIKRPAAVPKLAAFFKERAAKFVLDEKAQTLALKK